MRRSVAGRLFAVAVLTLALALPGAGCRAGGSKSGTGPGGVKGSTASKDSIDPDISAIQRTKVTDKLGAEFQNVTSEGTASVIVLPGAFPSGTEVVFTPMKPGGEGVYVSGFELKAGDGLQPEQPVFVAFETAKTLPSDAVLAAYQEGETQGTRLAARIAAGSGGSTLIAPVGHFTVFRIDSDGRFPHKDPPDDQNQSGFKAWSVKANSKVPLADAEPWDADWVLEADVVNPDGDITGPYEGPATLSMKGTLKAPPLTGTFNGSWSGLMKFDQATIYKIDWDKAPMSRTSGPNPAMHLAMKAKGTFSASTKQPLKTSVKGPGGLAGGWAAPGGLGESTVLDCMLYIGVAGAAIEIPKMGFFDAVPVGVLK